MFFHLIRVTKIHPLIYFLLRDWVLSGQASSFSFTSNTNTINNLFLHSFALSATKLTKTIFFLLVETNYTRVFAQVVKYMKSKKL